MGIMHNIALHVLAIRCDITVESDGAERTYIFSGGLFRFCLHKCVTRCITLGIIVTPFAWIAHKLVSSNNPTKQASVASCKAAIESAVKC